MDTPLPTDLREADLADALARAWALEVGQMHYIPKGFGSYHWLIETATHKYFLTVDDLDTKPWLGENRDSTFEGLEAAFDAALALRRQAHLAFVVAPIPQLGDNTAYRLYERYALTLFPFVDGKSGVWGDPIARADHEQLQRLLAALHRSTPAAAARAPRHGLDLPGRAILESALDDTDRPWTGGPYSEPARQVLANHAATVHEWLAAFDLLVSGAAPTGGEHVITHGEPHPGNLIHTDGGLRLVDWDTVGLAPPERDLWMLDDGTPDVLAPYVEASGRAVDDTAIFLFRLSWTLWDISAFTALFRADHGRNHGTEKSWRALSDSLAGATSTRPYGPTLPG